MGEGEGQRRKNKIKKEVQATASASYCRLLQMQGERTTHATHSRTQDLTPSTAAVRPFHPPALYIIIIFFSNCQIKKFQAVHATQCLTETGLRDLTLQQGPNKFLEGETQGKTVVHNVDINQDICTFGVV